MKPSYWLIHYKGQVSAPSDGEWRFWGDGEEVCSVAVNGKPVLLANWREITAPDVPWKSPEPPGLEVANSHLVAGTWFSVKKGEVIDLDVLIGERGGGVFCAFLLIEKKGRNTRWWTGNRAAGVSARALQYPAAAESQGRSADRAEWPDLEGGAVSAAGCLCLRREIASDEGAKLPLREVQRCCYEIVTDAIGLSEASLFEGVQLDAL